MARAASLRGLPGCSYCPRAATHQFAPMSTPMPLHGPPPQPLSGVYPGPVTPPPPRSAPCPPPHAIFHSPFSNSSPFLFHSPQSILHFPCHSPQPVSHSPFHPLPHPAQRAPLVCCSAAPPPLPPPPSPKPCCIVTTAVLPIYGPDKKKWRFCLITSC